MKKNFKFDKLKTLGLLVFTGVLVAPLPFLIYYQTHRPTPEEPVSEVVARTAPGGLGQNETATEEIASLRSENSKSFNLASGKKVAIIHSKPLHYHQTPDGPWLDIDTRWVPSKRRDFAWEMTKAPYKVWVADNLTASPFALVEQNGSRWQFRIGNLEERRIDGTLVRLVTEMPNLALGEPEGNVFKLQVAGYELKIVADNHKFGVLVNSDSEKPEDTQFIVPLVQLNFSAQKTFCNQEKNGFLASAVRKIFRRLSAFATQTSYYSETADGHIYGGSTVWATARATSTGFDIVNAYFQPGTEFAGGKTFYVVRGYLSFDTSALTDAVMVTAASLYICAYTDVSTTDFIVQAYRYAWEEPITATNREANFDGALTGTYENDIRNTADGWVQYTYYSCALATAGVNKTGDSKYVILSNRDYNNQAATGNEYVTVYSAEMTGTTYDPYLLVTYTYPPSNCYVTESLTNDNLTVYWTDDTDGEDQFEIYRSVDGAAFASLGTAAANATSYLDNTTTSNHTYAYRVRAKKGTSYTDWCTTPTYDTLKGGFRFEGVKMEGVKINWRYWFKILIAKIKNLVGKVYAFTD